jgi:hypothetical protein
MRPSSRLFFVLCALTLLGACNCGDRLTRSRAQIEAEPASIDFGTHPGGALVEREVVVRNVGVAPLIITEAIIEGDERSAFSFTGMPEQLAVSAHATVKVIYTAPMSEGPDGASLLIASGAENAPELRVSLSARSIAACAVGRAACDGACVDLQTSAAHCGSCERPCPAGESCQLGVCTCTPLACPAERQCGQVADGCGGTVTCGACDFGSVCTELGVCSCPGGETRELSCGDGLDNDCDGRIDCADSDCASLPECQHCIGGADHRVSFDTVQSGGAALAWNGSGFGVAWQQGDFSGPMTFDFARTDADGTPVSTQRKLNPNASVAHQARMVWNGTGYASAWSDIRDALESSNDVYFQRLDANGALLGPEVLVAGGPPVAFLASLAWSPQASE